MVKHYKDFLVDNKFYIVLGSGSEGLLEPTDVDIETMFIKFIRHYFQDNDFVLNNLYGHLKTEYDLQFYLEVTKPFVNDINAFRDKYLELGVPYPECREAKYWTMKEKYREGFNKEFFEKWIKTTKFKNIYEDYCNNEW